MNYLINERTKTRLERLILDRIPDDATSTRTPYAGQRFLSYIRVTGDADEDGFYPCKPTIYNSATDAWTDYANSLAFDANGLSLNSGERYLAVRYGVDEDGKFVFVVETALALKFARDAGWGEDFTYRRWVLNGYTYRGVTGYPDGDYAVLSPEYCDGTIPRDGIVSTADQNLGPWGNKEMGAASLGYLQLLPADWSEDATHVPPPSSAALNVVGQYATVGDPVFDDGLMAKVEWVCYTMGGTALADSQPPVAWLKLVKEPVYTPLFEGDTAPDGWVSYRLELSGPSVGPYAGGGIAYCCNGQFGIVSGTFQDLAGNTWTITGGIVTGKTTGTPGATGTSQSGDTITNGLVTVLATDGASGTDQAGNSVTGGRITAIGTDGASGTDQAGNSVTAGRITAFGTDGASGTSQSGDTVSGGRITSLATDGWNGSFTFVESVDFGASTTTTKTATVVSGRITDVS